MNLENILITDYHCASNRGDAAILEGVIFSLQKYFPDAKITVMTDYPISARIINQVNAVRQVMVPFRWTNIRKNIAGVYALIAAAVFSKLGITLPGMKNIRRKLSPYLEADLIVSTGGSFLNDFYAPRNLGRLWGLLFAKLLGKTVVLYAQSIGPINRTPYRQIARYVLNRMDLIILRDSKSKEILKSIGVTNPPIYITADAAFNMPLTDSKPMQLWRYEDVKPLDKVAGLKVSISVRRWHYYPTPNSHKQYVETMAALADWLIAEKNAQIFFISTCTGFAGYHTDDRVVAHEVINHMKCLKKKNPVILYGEYTPQELSTIYGYMDLHIGTRMHSIIFAMLAKTPVLAIQYEFKTAELMKIFGLEDYLVNINNIKFEELKGKVEKALRNREQLKRQISSKLPEIRMKSEQSAKLIFEMIRDKGVKK